MKSDIKFISYNDENFNKKNRDLKENIRFQIRRLIPDEEFRNTGKWMEIDSLYIILIYSKYIIEKNNLNYSDIIEGNIESLLPYLKDKFNSYDIECFINYSSYKVLKLMAFKPYQIECYQDRILDKYIEKDKKYLLISTGRMPYNKYPNVDVFERLIDCNTVKRFEVLDEILDINRNYYGKPDNIDLSKYDGIILLNNRIYQQVNLVMNDFPKFDKKVLMVCEYDRISNGHPFRHSNEIKDLIEKIIIDGDDVYIEFNMMGNYSEDKKINIKFVSKVKDDDLDNIIKSDELIDDVSINVSPDKIINNKCRIGFNIYNMKREKEKKNILDIVDENNDIIKKINRLDVEISRKINEMINK